MIGTTRSSATSISLKRSTPVSMPMRSQTAAKTSSGVLPAPAPSPAADPSMRLPPPPPPPRAAPRGGSVDAARARLERGERVRDAHGEVVVAVKAYLGLGSKAFAYGGD